MAIINRAKHIKPKKNNKNKVQKKFQRILKLINNFEFPSYSQHTQEHKKLFAKQKAQNEATKVMSNRPKTYQAEKRTNKNPKKKIQKKFETNEKI